MIWKQNDAQQPVTKETDSRDRCPKKEMFGNSVNHLMIDTGINSFEDFVDALFASGFAENRNAMPSREKSSWMEITRG